MKPTTRLLAAATLLFMLWLFIPAASAQPGSPPFASPSYDANEGEAILALVIAADVDCETGDMFNWAPEDDLLGDEGMFYVHSELDDEDDEENGED